MARRNAQELLEMPISRLIPKMAIPTIIAQLITTIYNLVDTLFVSSLGTSATAAIGVNSSLEQTIMLLGSIFATGGGSYLARLLGAKKHDDAGRVLSTVFYSSFATGIFLTIIGMVTLRPLVIIMGATEDCLTYSMQYGSYVLLAAPFMLTSLLLNQSLRNEGNSVYAMIGIGFGGILNCFLDPIFIFYLDYGVAGASMATAISKFVSFCILIWPYLRKTTLVAISVRQIRFVREDAKEVLSIGATSFFRAGANVLAGILTNNVAGAYSTAALAAISIANRIMAFPFAVVLGFGQGYQPVVGFNWGAKQFDRVRQSFRFASKVALIGGAVMGAVLFFAAPVLIPLFNRASDPEVLRLGLLCIRTQCLSLPAHSWPLILNMFYAGTGHPKEAMLMSTARQGYCYIPPLFILPLLFDINGVAICQMVADILTLGIAIPMAKNTNRVIARREQLTAQQDR